MQSFVPLSSAARFSLFNLGVVFDQLILFIWHACEAADQILLFLFTEY